MKDQTIAARIARKSGVPDLLDILTNRLTASELTSLLLEVFQTRAASVAPDRLLHDYEANRFTAPASTDMAECMAFELSLLHHAGIAGFRPLELSPVCPLGTCAAIATVDQNKVMSALRGTEVVADATNVLALESSIRRREVLRRTPRSTERFRFCTIHRHLRTPPIPDLPGFSQHFKVFCLTTAGRDEGGFLFERETLADHIALYISFLDRLGVPAHAVQITLKALNDDDAENPLFNSVQKALAQRLPDIPTRIITARQSDEQYYRRVNFKIAVLTEGEWCELADGGVVDWTQKLLCNNKERLVISGLGTERLRKAILSFRPSPTHQKPA